MSALEIDQGDDEVLDIIVREPPVAPATVGDPIDITNVQLHWAVRPSRGSSVLILEKSTPTEIEIAANQSTTGKGKATITLVPADTDDIEVKYLDRTLSWELDGIDTLGKKVTLGRGSIVIARDLAD